MDDCPDCDGSGFTSFEVDDDGMALATACPTCHVPPRIQPWHVISSDDLLAMLRRCHAGEDPDMVYIEQYVNTSGDVPA